MTFTQKLALFVVMTVFGGLSLITAFTVPKDPIVKTAMPESNLRSFNDIAQSMASDPEPEEDEPPRFMRLDFALDDDLSRLELALGSLPGNFRKDAEFLGFTSLRLSKDKCLSGDQRKLAALVQNISIKLEGTAVSATVIAAKARFLGAITKRYIAKSLAAGVLDPNTIPASFIPHLDRPVESYSSAYAEAQKTCK